MVITIHAASHRYLEYGDVSEQTVPAGTFQYETRIPFTALRLVAQ